MYNEANNTYINITNIQKRKKEKFEKYTKNNGNIAVVSKQSTLKNFKNYHDYIYFFRILLPDGPPVTNFIYNFEKSNNPVLIFVLDGDYNIPDELKYKNKISAKRDIKRRISEVEMDKLRLNKTMKPP